MRRTRAQTAVRDVGWDAQLKLHRFHFTDTASRRGVPKDLRLAVLQRVWCDVRP